MHKMPPHLSSPPLIMALARIEFAILPSRRLENSIDSLHDLLRSEYPDLAKGVSDNASLNPSLSTDNGQLSSSVVLEKTPYWLFRSAEYNWSVQIDINGVLVCTKAYSSSQDLCERTLAILTALHKAIKITHTRYVGVRFVNKIDLDNEGQFSALRSGYIQQKLPFAEGMGGSSYAARYKLSEGWLDIQSNLVIGGYVVPDDIRENAIKLNFAKEPVNEVFVTLDFDCKYISEVYDTYDQSKLREKIIYLTEQSKLGFSHVLTEEEIEKRR